MTDSDSDENADSGAQPDDDSFAPPAVFLVDWFPRAKVTILDPPQGNLLARQVKITTDRPCSLSAYITDDLEPGLGRSHPEATPRGIDHFLWFYGLAEKREYRLTIRVADHPEQVVFQGAFSTPKLPDGVPRPTLVEDAGEAARDEWVAFGVDVYIGTIPLRGYVMILDRAGQIRYVHEIANSWSGPIGVVEGMQVLSNGDMVTSSRDDVVVSRLDGTEYVINPQLDGLVLSAAHHQGYFHEGEPFHILTLFNQVGPGLECDLATPTTEAVSDGIAELDAQGRETWRWTTLDHPFDFPPDQQNQSVCRNMRNFWGPGTFDWTHANIVSPIPSENAYLLSFRNISRIVKIDRDTGDVLWQMGPTGDFAWLGSEPFAERWFLGQHDAQLLDDGHLLLFDNSNCRYDPNCRIGRWSRALELEVDEQTRTVRQVWEFRVPFSPSRGSVQRLANGNTLIDSGFGGHLFEATTDGREIWHVRFAFHNHLGWARSYPALWDYDTTP